MQLYAEVVILVVYLIRKQKCIVFCFRKLELSENIKYSISYTCEQLSRCISFFFFFLGYFSLELNYVQHRVLIQFGLVLGAARNVKSKNGGGLGFVCHLLTHSWLESCG